MSDDEASGSENEVEVIEPPQKRLKLTLNKPEKEKFSWTLARKIAFAKVVSHKRGHLSQVKDGLKKGQRWEAIRLEVMKLSQFADLDISHKSLMNKFAEETKKILESCGVTKQSVNLSGFANKPPEYEELILSMAEEADKQKGKNSMKKKLKDDRKKLLSSITANSLSGTKNDTSVALPLDLRRSPDSGLTDEGGSSRLSESVPTNRIDSLFCKLESMMENLGPETERPETETEKLNKRKLSAQADYYEYMLQKEKNKE